MADHTAQHGADIDPSPSEAVFLAALLSAPPATARGYLARLRDDDFTDWRPRELATHLRTAVDALPDGTGAGPVHAVVMGHMLTCGAFGGARGAMLHRYFVTVTKMVPDGYLPHLFELVREQAFRRRAEGIGKAMGDRAATAPLDELAALCNRDLASLRDDLATLAVPHRARRGGEPAA